MRLHLYLSPHLDDAVLSCGGQIAQSVRAGHRVRVITVFAGDAVPQAAVSPHVQELHRRWQLDPDNPIPGRRAEDLAALQTLGVDAQDILHLAFPDCVYRLGKMGWPLYFTRDAIFGEIAPVEAPLIEQITSAIGHPPRKAAIGHQLSAIRDPQSAIKNQKSKIILYLPLAAGHHVDHQMVRRAGEKWFKSQIANLKSRISMAYYEDYPYAEKPETVRAALGAETFRVELVELDEAALEAKIAAIACYRSQLSTFFADATEMAARVRAYAQGIGASRPAERLWHRGIAQGDL